MVKKTTLKVMIASFLFLLASAALMSAGGAKQSSAVASVNGVMIPKEYLTREVRRFEEQAFSQGQAVDESQRDVITRQALDTLIDIELLYQESQRRGFQITEERIEKQVSDLRAQFSDDDGFAGALEQIGISQDELRTEFKRQIAIQDMIDLDIAPSVSVSEQEQKDYYESNPDFFFVPEEVKARHILILVSPEAGEEEKSAARSRIEEIRKRIVAGEDFAELAGRFSEDGSSADGGDLGYFRREQMVKPFADVAFSLEVGQLSEIVATEFGFHLIQVTDKKAASKIPYKEIQDRIDQYLHREKVMVAIEELAARLRTQAEIEEYTLPEG